MAQRELRYGDIIHLSTNTGVVGSFYPFPFLNQLLVLDTEGPGIQQSQALWCNFIVLPPYAYKKQAALSAEFSLNEKDWAKISRLEKEVITEKQENKKRFARSVTHTVRYLQQVQLKHVITGKYLGHSPSRTSLIELRNFPCCLKEFPNNNTRLLVYPVMPVYSAGDSVYSDDVINLFMEPDGFARSSIQPVQFAESFYPSVQEINIGPVNQGFKLHLHHNDGLQNRINPSDGSEIMETILKHVAGTDIIQLRKSRTSQYYIPDEDGLLYLKSFQLEHESQKCSELSTYWIIEHDSDDGTFNNDVIKPSSIVRLRSFVSGELVRISPEEGDFSDYMRINIDSALEVRNGRDSEATFNTGAHVKLKTNQGFVGGIEEGYVSCGTHFSFTNTITLREVDINWRRFGARILGFKMLVEKIITTDTTTVHLSLNNHKAIISAINDALDLLVSHPESAQNLVQLGVASNLLKLAKIYIAFFDMEFRISLCLDGICRLLNHLTNAIDLNQFEKEFLEVISFLINGRLAYCSDIEKTGSSNDEESEGEEYDVKEEKVLSPLKSLLENSLYLLSIIPYEFVQRLVKRFDNCLDKGHKNETSKILCCLCRVRGRAFSFNQATIFDSIFGGNISSSSFFKHSIKNDSWEAYYENIPVSSINPKSQMYLELLSQLELYTSLLLGRHKNHKIRDKLIDQNGMFTLGECVYVLKNKDVDTRIKSLYIQILIAAHIDSGPSENPIIAQMLTFQYGEVARKVHDNSEPPNETQLLYKNILHEVQTFLQENVCHNDTDPEHSYQMIRLLEYLFKCGYINQGNECLFIAPLIGFLEGSNTRSSRLMSIFESKQSFKNTVRFESGEINHCVFEIKGRAMKALYRAFEGALFDYWTRTVTEIYSTVRNYDQNKDKWLSKIVDFLGMADMRLSLHEVIINIFEDPIHDILSPKEKSSRQTLKAFLTENYNSTELFSRVNELVRVLMDTMRSENPYILETGMRLLVMVTSPTTKLLELLPKSEITLSNIEFSKRQIMVKHALQFHNAIRDEISPDSKGNIIKAMEQLENSLTNADSKVRKARQRLLFDLGTVSHIITLLKKPKLFSRQRSSEQAMTDDSEVTTSVNKLVSKALSLLRHLTRDFPPVQKAVMLHFEDIVNVKAFERGDIIADKDEMSDLEVARVQVLNEVFTANTNISIKVNEQILQVLFDKLSSLVNVNSIEDLTVNSKATYRYWELLENIIDVEDHDQIVFRLEASVLRLTRDYWEKLNGSIISKKGTRVTLNLLKSQEMIKNVGQIGDNQIRDWKSIYFVKSLSLIACCCQGSVTSFRSICKDMVPYHDLVPLASTTDVVCFGSATKFFLKVYVKSAIHIKQRRKMSDTIIFLEKCSEHIKTLFTSLLQGGVDEKLSRLSLLREFDVKLKRLENESANESLMELMDCVMNSTLPFIVEIYSSPLKQIIDGSDGDRITGDLSANLRNLLRATSNFLLEDDLRMLFAAIRAVNSYNISPNKETLEVAADGKKWRVQPDGASSLIDGEKVTSNIEILVRDVVELKREKNLQQEVIEQEENNRINEMYQRVLNIIQKVVKSEIPELFLTNSDECRNLGSTILGTRGVSDDDEQFTEAWFSIPGAAADMVLENLVHLEPPSLTYQSKELWQLTRRVFSWLKEFQDKDTFIVRQLIDSITLQLTELKQIKNSCICSEIVSMLLEIGCVEMLCSHISRTDTAVSATTCLSCLLEYPDIQMQMLHVCRSNDQLLFEWVWKEIENATAGYTQLKLAGRAMTTAVSIHTATRHMRLAVQFVGKLCHKTPKLQDYMRNQDNKTVTHNFLSDLLNLLKAIPNMQILCSTSRSQEELAEQINFIVDILLTLLEMLSTNTKAKEYAIEMFIIESIDRLLDDQKKPLNLSTVTNKEDTKDCFISGCQMTQEQELMISSNCYDVLIALLEYDEELLDVDDKILDVLNVTALQQSVNGHLVILNQTAHGFFSDNVLQLREMACAATFKGYTVLKKLYVSDKHQGALLNIDEKLEETVHAESVEVIWNDSLEKLYFPSSPHSLLRRKVKDEMLWGLSRKTLTDKNIDFLFWADEILVDMDNVFRLQKIPVVNSMVNLEFLWDWLVLLLAIVIQIWLLVDLQDYDMVYKTKTVECGSEEWPHLEYVGWSPGGKDDTQQVCVSTTYYTFHTILGGMQLLSTLLLTCTYILTNSHRFEVPYFDWRAFIFRERGSNDRTDRTPEVKRMSIALHSFYHLWLVIIIATSCMGIKYYGALFCTHLLHIIPMFDLLTRVIKGATANRDQLLVVIPFLLVIIYIYSMVYFIITRTMFLNTSGEYCDSLFQCFTTALRYSIRTSNGGHNYSWTDKKTFPDVWIRIAIDGSFWLLYSIIGLKVVTALVLDGFTSQKKEREAALADMASFCTICGSKKDDYSSKGVSWKTHISREHNIWSYVNFFYYLQTSKSKRAKLSAIEDEVLLKFKNKDISFLPWKTSLSWKAALNRESKTKLRRGFRGPEAHFDKTKTNKVERLRGQ